MCLDVDLPALAEVDKPIYRPLEVTSQRTLAAQIVSTLRHLLSDNKSVVVQLYLLGSLTLGQSDCSYIAFIS